MRKRISNSIRGFTIVELLIVIVIIGILATLVIVAYNGVQQRARASATTTALAQVKKKLELYKIDNGGYPLTNNLSAADVTNGSTTYQYTSTDGTTFCVTGTTGDVSYKATETTSPSQGGCPGHGQGGVSAVTNLVANPSAEIDTNGLGCINCALARQTVWSASGSASFSLTPTTASNDSFMHIGGDLGGFRTGLEAGKTYTISGTARLSSAQTGTLHGQARRVTAWYTNGGHTVVQGSQAPNSAGTFRSSVTFSIPASATAAWIRLYNGASSGNGVVWWDDIMITEGSSLYNYADGGSANWIWNGTAHSSTSTGPAL